ncbi:17-beta-hydroxysteroid dehydrogenase 14 [Lamellibrachia satsuma]|nr:17-beta-hydroxysteroid dehydrogenase 14 [Lamellibrachia satsuma]
MFRFIVAVENGAKVVFCAKQEEQKVGGELEDELSAKGPGVATFVPCDVTKEEDIKKLINTTVEKYGTIDCLINNAGTHPPHMPIDDFSAGDFRELFEFHVIGHFLTSKYALPYLRKSKGNIIFNASLVATIGQHHAVTYVATKGALVAMTRALAIDEAVHGVRVNSFSPGNIWTPLWNRCANETEDPQGTIETGKKAQLLGRMGTPKEVAQLCLFMASEATFLTGSDILLSGGAEFDFGLKARTTTQTT